MPNCDSPHSDPSYGKNCAYLSIEGSQFRDFDYFFSTELSLSGSAAALGEQYHSSKTNRFRASLLHLIDYEGLARVTGSTFENLFLKRSECFYSETKGHFRATVEFAMADGKKQHGQYFIETDQTGRATRMIGFVGLGDPE